jgi:hypothetical protein
VIVDYVYNLEIGDMVNDSIFQLGCKMSSNAEWHGLLHRILTLLEGKKLWREFGCFLQRPSHCGQINGYCMNAWHMHGTFKGYSVQGPIDGLIDCFID